MFKTYTSDFNQMLHIDKNHQVLFMRGPSKPKTNPRWRIAAILKFKIPIYPQRFKLSQYNTPTLNPIDTW